MPWATPTMMWAQAPLIAPTEPSAQWEMPSANQPWETPSADEASTMSEPSLAGSQVRAATNRSAVVV
eukprot:4222409-Pyramimonas_sp.AAC.1